MKKKSYEKPAMRVVMLQHQSHLLQASGIETLSGSKGATEADDLWYDLE